MKKIILLSIICLMLSACGKSAKDKIIGMWEFKEGPDAGIWEFEEDFTVRLIVHQGPTESFEWTLFQESSGDDPSLVLMPHEDDDFYEGMNIEFLTDDKILASRMGRRKDDSKILTRIKD